MSYWKKSSRSENEMPSVPNAILPPVSMMSRTRQMPAERRMFDPGSF